MVARGPGRLGAVRVCLLLLLLPLAACLSRAPGSELPGPGRAGSVYVVSDGWHSGIVVERAQISSTVWPEQSDFAGSRYLEIGWGDKTAYMAHRMTTRLGLNAAFRSASSALHVAGFNEPVLERFGAVDVAVVQLESRTLDDLGRFLEASYARDRDGNPFRLGPGYSAESAFYLATGRFHLFNTCNTWVARALRSAGVPIVPALALTASQLMHQVASIGTVLRARAP